MEDRKQHKELIIDGTDSNSFLEADLQGKMWGNALGFEVEGTLSVREPAVLDVVSKPLHRTWGSLKHPPGHDL